MLEFNYTDCFHYVDLDTKEVIHTVTNNDYGLGDRYTRDIVPITVDGTMYYPVFAFKNGLVAYPDKSASDIVIKCENYFVMENDIFNTWIVFCVDSENKLSTVQYQNIEDYLDRMYITTSDFSIESEDDNLLSLNITTGATGDGFASYGSTFSPTCNVEMVKSEDGDFEAYIALNSEFYVVGEVLGIKQCFGRFWINERPRIMNETFTFSGIGALDYKASNIELNVKETTEKNVELITEKYGAHIIKDWNYYWEFIERDFFDATGVPLIIPGWEELVDKMAEYHTYQLMIPYIQSSTTNETTSVEQYEFAKFNWREILSGVAVLLKRNVIEKNGSIYIESISEEDVAINLRFNEDCYEDGSDFDNILVSPYPINVVSNRFYNNYTDNPYAYSNDTNSITTQLQIPNSIYGNLVNYSVNIECPWITWELADRIHYSGYAFPVYDAYMQKNALWGQFLNIAKRFSYNPAQISFVGYHPLLSAGNLVSVESYDGAGKLIYVAEMTLSYDGGVTISVNSKADIQTNATNSSSATSSQGSASSTSTATQSGMTNGIMYGTTIKDGVFDGGKIKDGTIEGSKIADSAITGSKIDFSTFENGVIKGSSIDTSTFTDGQISGSVIDTTTFLDGTISGSVIESSTLKDIPFASMDEAFIGNLMSDDIFADTLKAEVANIGALTVEDADIRYADIKLGNIDVANVNKANIGLLFAEVGLIDRATIVDGHVTGFLDAVEVNANKITAGTLIADRILLSGEEDSVLFALNNLGELTSANVDTLDGYVLTDRTINADKIVAGSITANEIDVEDLFAQDITASGTITGANLIGTTAEINNGSIGGFSLEDGVLTSISSEGFKIKINPDNGIDFYKLDIENNIYKYHSGFDGSKLAIGDWQYGQDNVGMFHSILDNNLSLLSSLSLSYNEIDKKYLFQSAQSPLELNFTSVNITSDVTAPKFIGRLDGYLKSSDSRLENLNVEVAGTGGLYRYTSVGTDSTSKPARNAHILHCAWDTAAGLQDSQLAVLTGDTTAGLQVRGRNTSTGVYGSWYTFLHSGNYNSYPVTNWKVLSSAKSQVSITSLNANKCNEVYVTASKDNIVVYSTLIPYSILNSTQRQFVEGYDTGTYTGTCTFLATNTYIGVTNFRQGNVNYNGSEVTVTVYYR